MASAQEWLEAQGLGEVLQGAVKTLVQERPDNARARLIEILTEQEVAAMREKMPVATPVTTLQPNMPPGRVRALFKRLDKNGDRVLTLAELEDGFEKEFEEHLPAHAKEAIPVLFEKAAEPLSEKPDEKVLKIYVFSRFYAEVLFMYFDKARRSAPLAAPPSTHCGARCGRRPERRGAREAGPRGTRSGARTRAARKGAAALPLRP